MAKAYRDIGQDKKAIEFFEEALQIYLNYGKQKEVTLIYFSLGMIYYENGDETQAKELFNKAVEIEEKYHYIQNEYNQIHSNGNQAE